MEAQRERKIAESVCVVFEPVWMVACQASHPGHEQTKSGAWGLLPGRQPCLAAQPNSLSLSLDLLNRASAFGVFNISTSTSTEEGCLFI